MMISTILLIVNACFLFFKDKALFSFKHFWWIYPTEIILYIIFYFLGSKVAEIIFNNFFNK